MMKKNDNVSISPPGRPAGQRVSLVPTLQRLIRDYPAGLGIVKEFLQNADDAGATWLKVTFDQRAHSTRCLPAPNMAPLMGPAILIASDQVFSPEDLERIQEIGEGGKIQDVQKTGQFGVGFNTAYTITDYPAFATGDLIRCFDPLRDAVAVGGEAGREWEIRELWQKWSDWPQAFGIEPDRTTLDYTVFRLPLRTAAQARPGRLSQAPFEAVDVERVFKEVLDFGSALLLFTRNVLNVELSHILPDGTNRKVLHIRTVNLETVRKERSKLHLTGPAEHTLAAWAKQPDICPNVIYGHKFVVEGPDQQIEYWLVAQGFEPGDRGSVISAAQRMIEIGKKALPRVGAAILLRSCGDGLALARTVGRIFCSLPLPGSSGLPFHINGFFDLDSSRTEPVHGRLAGDAAIREQWNRALAEQAIPAIVERLLASVTDRIKERDIAGTYAVWPGGAYLRSQKAWIPEIGREVVRRLSNLPLIRMRHGTNIRWLPARDARRPTTSWPRSLSSVLRDDGFELIDPELPAEVLEDLKGIGALPPYCTRSDFRKWLAQDIDCQLSNAPLQCLRKIEHITSILDYFLEEREPQISGLPLALRQDGRLKIFQENDIVVAANHEIRNIFESWPEWFIHTSLEASLFRHHPKHAGVLYVRQREVLNLIRRALGTSIDGIPVHWGNGLLEVQDFQWLESVILFLVGHPPSDPANDLRKVPLIPDQMATLRALYWPNTPAFPPEQLSPDERVALDAFRVPLVAGPPSLVDTLRLLSRKLPKRSFPTLTQAIALQLLDSAVPPAGTSDAHRETLLNLLARSHCEEPLSTDVMERLADAPIWPVDDGRFEAARTENVFVPAGFNPPPIGQGVPLFRNGPGGCWSSILRALGARPFSAAAYVERLFGTIYQTLDPTAQRLALEWVATSSILEDLRREDSAPSKRASILLRTASLVRCTDGLLHSGRTLYHPDEVGVHALLGSQAPIPDMGFYGEPKDAWLQLFERLEMTRAPRAVDIVERIYELIDRAEICGAADVEPEIVALIEHLGSKWSILKDRKIDDRRLSEILKELEWMPALRGEQARSCYGVSSQLENRLHYPRELFARTCGHLVASQEPLLATDAAVLDIMLTELDVQHTVPLATAVRHFNAVVAATTAGEAPALTAITSAANTFYRLIASVMQPGGALPPELAALRQHPCVWDAARARFMAPSHCFAVEVNFFGSLRAFIPAEGSEADGLDRLGRRSTPEVDDFVSFLRDLAAHTMGRVLQSDERDAAIYALRRIHASVEGGSKINDLMILTSDMKLCPSSQVLIDDAPWWRERMLTGPVALLHESVSPEIMARCHLKSAAQALREVIAAVPLPAQNEAVASLCKHFEMRVQAPAFEQGLRRLIYHEYQRFDIDLVDALDIEFVPCGPIRTALTDSPLSPSSYFGEEDVEVFLEGTRLYISAETTDVLPLVAVAINRRLDTNTLTNLAPFEEILRLGPQDIERALNRRKIPALPAAAAPTKLRWEDPEEPLPDFGSSPIYPEDMPTVGFAAASTESADMSTDPDDVSDVDPALGPRARSAPSEVPYIPRRPRSFPSSTPGDGSTIGPTTGRGSRLRSYLVAPDNSRGVGAGARSRAPSAEVFAAAIDHVCRYEERRAGAGLVTVVSELGHDLLAKGLHGQSDRFIRVKGIDGTWLSWGIGLTPEQIEAARELGSRFWLYVVEHATDPDQARVFAISNPISQTAEFFFDDGWRNFAESDPSVIIEPTAGLYLYRQDLCVGRIEEVITAAAADGQAALSRLKVRTPEDDLKQITYSPSRHSLKREQ